MSVFHVPVLADTLVRLGRDAKRVVDGTLGDGGHAERFLSLGATVLGIDRDPAAIAQARQRLGGAGLRLLQGDVFDPLVVAEIRAFRPQLVLLDLGVSSRQLDQDDRGFTFRPGAPLDMRMGSTGPTAAERLNQADPKELAQWFRDYADEPRAGRLARIVERRRANRPFRTSDDLVNAIREALGPRAGPGEFARLFQAVRIGVNRELEGLKGGLPRLRDALEDGGIIAVISYHSGEDRLVKHAFREWSRSCICPPGLPACRCRGRSLGQVLTRRALVADEIEVVANPRARSARLRAFQVKQT
jgi:16S rRNA (cytosine1402-N4)-methyltransferase